MIIATLGTFAFAPDRGSVDELTRDASFDWASPMPLGTPPVMQFAGLGDTVVTINGEAHLELSPNAGVQLTTLEALAEQGKPLPFVLGSRVFGLWCVTRISRTGTLFNRKASPGILSFVIEMKRYHTQDATREALPWLL